jgi:hypothetical protein
LTRLDAADVSQTGVGAMQAPSFPAVHCTQRLSSVQARMPSGQPMTFDAVQGTHVFVIMLQAGVLPPQSSSVRHSPQTFIEMQMSRAPLHPGLHIVASGTMYASGMNASLPASGMNASKTLNASVFASARTAASMSEVPVSVSAQRPSTIALPSGHCGEGQPEKATSASAQ